MPINCNDLSSATRINFLNEIEEPGVNWNRSLANITCEINNKIHTEMGKLERSFTVVSNLVGFLILLLILEAIWYWWSYIHKVMLPLIKNCSERLLLRTQSRSVCVYVCAYVSVCVCV